MPADGAGALPAGASVPPKAEAPPADRGLRRSRIRRFVFVAYGVTAALHVVPVLAATLFVSPLVALSGGAAVLAVTLGRLRAMVREKRRPGWFTVLVDEPVLGHWCASLLATLLAPLLVIVGFVGVAVGAFGAGAHGLAASRIVSAAAFASYAFSAAVAAWGFTGRRRFIRVAYIDIPISGLAPDLDGYRIVQVSDLHIGNYDTKTRGLAWAARVNALGPDLVAVTGDLVTTGTVFYPDVADVIGAMRSKDGVFVSMGN
ncbi:MAG TPA: metallophosphoesterase, partial [Polyangiaceae bacterium]